MLTGRCPHQRHRHRQQYGDYECWWDGKAAQYDVARNTSGFGGPDCDGLITSLGHNLIGDVTGCDIILQPTDLTGESALGAFMDNGAPGRGHVPLLSTSQAINAGDDAACPSTDQLGQARVEICDIGAIEFRP
jgi:hypothetical protein